MRIICYLKLLLFTNYTSTFKSVCNHEFYHTTQKKFHINIHERSRIKFFKKTQISYQLKKQNHGQNSLFLAITPSVNPCPPATLPVLSCAPAPAHLSVKPGAVTPLQATLASARSLWAAPN